MTQAPPLSSDAEPGKRIGSFELIELLGVGGMGEVWLAERIGDAGFRKKVALKRIRPEGRSDQVLVERFLTEARTNARLDHPNVCQVIDFGAEPEPFLALEYVEGVSLEALLTKLASANESLGVPAAMHIATEIARGLDHAHRQADENGTPLGIVHRDISPANVLLSQEGAVKVADFGLAQVADNRLETFGAVPVGRFCYMAPEQLSGGHVDARADLFALGATLWEMLTMRRLIPTNEPKEVWELLQSTPIVPPSDLAPNLWPNVDETVLALLRLDPQTRPPSAQSVALALSELCHQHAPGYGPEAIGRMVCWAFPEKGFRAPEPSEPPPQPTFQERVSLTQAAVETERADRTRSQVKSLKWLGWTAAIVGGVVVIAILAFALGLLCSTLL